MAITGLKGPFALNEKSIDANVKGVGPGAYALGRDTSTGYYVDYVGRSDSDVNGRLKDWANSKYTHFKCDFFSSAKAAFEKECHLFHDFGGTKLLDNKVHPARPKGTNWTCPVSGCTDLL